MDRDLTQEALAELAGVSRDTIVRIEGGRLEVKLGNLSRVAHALNVRIAELLE